MVNRRASHSLLSLLLLLLQLHRNRRAELVPRRNMARHTSRGVSWSSALREPLQMSFFTLWPRGRWGHGVPGSVAPETPSPRRPASPQLAYRTFPFARDDHPATTTSTKPTLHDQTGIFVNTSIPHCESRVDNSPTKRKVEQMMRDLAMVSTNADTVMEGYTESTIVDPVKDLTKTL